MNGPGQFTSDASLYRRAFDRVSGAHKKKLEAIDKVKGRAKALFQRQTENVLARARNAGRGPAPQQDQQADQQRNQHQQQHLTNQFNRMARRR
jgi:hypothetical protein